MLRIYRLFKLKDGVIRTFRGKIVTVNGVSFKMKRVSGGSFLVNKETDTERNSENSLQRSQKVSVGDFYIGETLVTQRLWIAVMRHNPSDCRYSGDHPVESVSKSDVLKFIRKLNKLTGLRFRLPSEAEWEFAARGGNKSKGYEFSGSNSVSRVAWYENNSAERSHRVAQKKPNELGLYDMSGNVSEWCGDVCQACGLPENFDSETEKFGAIGVLRGGNYSSRKYNVGVGVREFFPEDKMMDVYGFRLAL